MIPLLVLLQVCVCARVYIHKGTAEIYLLISSYKQANTIYFIEMEIIAQFECLCFKKADIRCLQYDNIHSSKNNIHKIASLLFQWILKTKEATTQKNEKQNYTWAQGKIVKDKLQKKKIKTVII